MKTSEEDDAALKSFAAEHGRRWKEALRLQWYHARVRTDRDARLHALRNAPWFGHAGLIKYRLPKD